MEIEASERAERVGRARRVLIVEDSPSIRTLYRAALERHGYTILEAADGAAGLEAAMRQRPDLIVVDVVMPRLDGLTMIEQLREAEGLAGSAPVPVLLVSALHDLLDTDPGSLGIVAVLDKARLTPRDIAEAVATYLAPPAP
jgi:two-component system alkaline phosphatase synthesis response regulator PhoP